MAEKRKFCYRLTTAMQELRRLLAEIEATPNIPTPEFLPANYRRRGLYAAVGVMAIAVRKELNVLESVDPPSGNGALIEACTDQPLKQANIALALADSFLAQVKKKPEKKDFCVAVTGLFCVRRVINVKAVDEEEAETIAIKQATDDGDRGWQLNGIFNDGKPHSQLEAAEIEEGEDSL